MYTITFTITLSVVDYDNLALLLIKFLTLLSDEVLTCLPLLSMIESGKGSGIPTVDCGPRKEFSFNCV